MVKLLGWSKWTLHVIGPKLFPREVLAFAGDTQYVTSDYLPEHWRADIGGFESRGYIHVQTPWLEKGPLGHVGETRWLEQVCGPDLLKLVAHADLGADALPELLDAHAAASPRFAGVRDMLAHDPDKGVMNYDEQPHRCTTEAWVRGFAELGRRGLTFDAWMYHPQLREFETVVRAHPETRVVLDHLGTPVGVGGPFASYGQTAAARARILAQWREDLAALAAHEQVHAKISGLLMPVLGWGFHKREQPPSRSEIADLVGPLVEYALDLFGPQRCMYASNFPMDKVSVPLTMTLEVLDELTQARDESERRGLFHDNAARFYGIDV